MTAAQKKADEEARARQKQEEGHSRNKTKANRNLPRDEFRSLVVGKSKQQLIECLGKPDDTQDQEPEQRE